LFTWLVKAVYPGQCVVEVEALTGKDVCDRHG